MNTECPLCGHNSERQPVGRKTVYDYACPVCGSFTATEEALSFCLPQLPDRDRHHLSALARERTVRHLPQLFLFCDKPTEDAPEGAYTVAAALRDVFPRGTEERAMRVLQNLAAMTESPGGELTLSMDTDLPVLMAETDDAAAFILRELEQRGLVNLDGCMGAW